MHLHEEIWKWSSTLPDWQNDLLRRLYERSNLSEQEVMQVKENVLSSVLDIYSERFCCKVKNHVIFILKNEK